MRILAIETSCDETAAAVVKKDKTNNIKVLSHTLASSAKQHAKTGGIIPENAARQQVKFILPLIVKSLLDSEEKLASYDGKDDFTKANRILKKNIDAIAITQGPGLIGSLLVGVETVKTLSFCFKKPLIPVNHLLGHVFANFINKAPHEINFPAISLIVSGGHTDLLHFENVKNYKWLGGTRDDAAGEAMDKIGRLLGLSYPAGGEIEKRAKKAQASKLRFRSPLINSEDFDFSFSGLKTEVARFISSNTMTDDLKNEVCFATQKAVVDVLIKKTVRASKMYKTKSILLGGGVAANETLKKELQIQSGNLLPNVKIYVPPKYLCTDNAAMIGAYALIAGQKKSWKTVNALPNLYFA